MKDVTNWYMENKPDEVPEDHWKLLIQYAGVIGENMKLQREINQLKEDKRIMEASRDYWFDLYGELVWGKA